MSIYRKDTIIHSYRAFDVFEREPDGQGINLVDGELITTPEGRRYTVGSVVGYALEYNECPIKAYQRAIEKGHKTHYIIQLSISLTHSRGEKRRYLRIDFDSIYRFQGQRFKIIPTPNDNLAFEEV